MSLMKKILLSLTLASTPLSAEIVQVTLVWQAGLCTPACIRELNQQLSRINGVDQINMNEGAGRAYLTWKKDAPFSFQPINMATRFVGIRINDIRLKVKGRISGSGSNLQLISDGDNTRFSLLNPITSSPNQYSVSNSVYTRQLSADVIAKLIETVKNKETVTVEGQFFEPFRSPPNNLVAERIEIVHKKP